MVILPFAVTLLLPKRNKYKEKVGITLISICPSINCQIRARLSIWIHPNPKQSEVVEENLSISKTW